jgi:hypothetical protein
MLDPDPVGRVAVLVQVSCPGSSAMNDVHG